mmetsp:Transcript_8834/g.26560  ORF Transcript_8834/g.26560 Transcript_8834/m.26560 type:complete len:673 (+) Transcript_8834:43-2061(+)
MPTTKQAEVGSTAGELVSRAEDPKDGGSARTCPFSDLVYKPFADETTNCAYDIFRVAAKKHGNNNCLGWRPKDSKGVAGAYKWHSYAKVHEYVVTIGNALTTVGLKKGDKVGIYAKNCPNWSMVELAVSAMGMVLVPLYDSLGANAVEYVCNHAELKIVFVQDENLEAFEKAHAACSSIKTVVVMESGDVVAKKSKDLPLVKSGKAVTLEELLAKGTNDESKLTPGSVDDLFVVMYTSGTTGDPKGVTLKNEALLSSVSASHAFFGHYNHGFRSDDVMLSYLPLAHIFEQQSEMLFLSVGGSIGYYQGDVRLLLEDMETLKPTIFIGVPRVFSKFEAKIVEAVENGSFVKKTLFNRAYRTQVEAVKNSLPRSKIWDKLVFQTVKRRLLPRVRLVVTGSAPMSAQTNDFLKVCLMCPVVQGYGLTETVGGAVCSAPGISKSGHCGGPLPCLKIKIVDVLDMGYSTKDTPNPRGEIHLKGPCVTSGYYKNQRATEDAFDADGWFATGDIGQWLPDGSLQIIDRKKNLFKLAQGEYVSPEALEQEYAKVKLVGQIWVYGNSYEPSLVAIVVPDVSAAQDWANKNKVGDGNVQNVYSDPAFKNAVLEELRAQRKAMNFKGYEEIKDICFETNMNELYQGFTVENGLLTPTFKLKRPQLLKKYQPMIDEMYQRLKAS